MGVKDTPGVEHGKHKGPSIKIQIRNQQWYSLEDVETIQKEKGLKVQLGEQKGCLEEKNKHIVNSDGEVIPLKGKSMSTPMGR